MDGVCRFMPCAPTYALIIVACCLVIAVLLRLYAPRCALLMFCSVLRALVSVRLRLVVRVGLADFSVRFAAQLCLPGYTVL